MENSSYNITKYVEGVYYMRKNLCILFIIFLVLTIIPMYSYASDTGLGDLNSYSGGSGSSTRLENMTEQILGVIQVIGTIAAVAMLMVIGIKYMLGSIEEKAEYKETLKPYLIGAFILFSGSTVPQIIYQIAKNF